MKRQERRGAYGDGDLSDSSSAEEKCPEAEQQPVTRGQAWRSLARTAQDDQLLLEQKILRDHRAHATGATQCRGHDGQVKQGEQEVLHARDSVGQTSGAMQRGLNPGFSERIGNSRRTGPGWPRPAARRTARPATGSRRLSRRGRSRSACVVNGRLRHADEGRGEGSDLTASAASSHVSLGQPAEPQSVSRSRSPRSGSRSPGW